MSEPLSLSKFFGSFFTKIYWVKVVALGIGIFFLLGVGYTGYKAVLKPSQQAEIMDAPNYYLQPNIGGCATIKVYKEKK